MPIKLVLLDLDDTLLGGSMAALWSDYFPLIDQWMSERLGLPNFLPRLLIATDYMLKTTDPLLTNQERFLQAFLDGLGLDEATVMAAFDEFYATQYPHLESTVTRLPAARPLVAWLLAHGHCVVIATNPLFPRAAIEQRLAWAGIPADEFDYALVTTLENMHDVKPHRAYFEEVLARTGHAPGEAIMVGDSLEHDLPAVDAGLHFYWIRTPGNGSQEPPTVPIAGAGTLDDFARQVCDEGWLDTLG